jgi:hypothetical protein
MEILGFPKTGGFLSLFGGQEESMGTPPQMRKQDSSVMMKNSEEMMKEASPQEIVSNSAPRRGKSGYPRAQVDGEAPQRPQRQERPRDMMKPSGSSIKAEIKMIKNDIQRLQSDVSELQSSSGSSSRGLFGGRRKTLRRMRKHRR